MTRSTAALLAGALSLVLTSQAAARPESGQVMSPPPAEVTAGLAPASPPLTAPAAPSPCPAASPGCCDSCGPGGRAWVRAEYLLWWIEGLRVPPLLTAGAPGSTIGSAGALGAPGTRVLLGNTGLNDNARHGLRLTAGTWLDDGCTLGVQGSFFILEGQGTAFTAGSADGRSIVSRPFTNAVTGRPDIQLVSFPGVLAGTGRVEAGSNNFLGADLLGRLNLCCGQDLRVDVLAGYRYFRFSERLSVVENLRPLAAPAVPGSSIVVRDSFATDNDFHGGALGVSAQFCRGPWSLEVAPRVNLGCVQRSVRIAGSTTTAVPGAGSVTRRGGLLAQSSNIGERDSSEFAAIPELNLTAGYRLSRSVRLLAGYSWLYWTNVARAGDQIDTTVNPGLLPRQQPAAGPARPASGLRESDMWVQGLRLGVELSF